MGHQKCRKDQRHASLEHQLRMVVNLQICWKKLHERQSKKVLDVTGGKDAEGQKVIVWGRHNRPNQRWTIVYIDRARKEATSGLNRNFGFEINKSFYFRSRLPMKRVAEVVGTDVRLRRYTTSRVRQQTFKFDNVSKTIKSEYHRSYSLEIPNQGRNNQLRVTTTNSRWW
jgi:hypothetical protein